MNWETIKEQGVIWYGKAAQFFLFQNIVMYLFACVTAHAAIGLPHYIGFLDHCCHWWRK
jgi:hypothetical protein